MADRDDFGYFGEGTEGYIQYLQTFARTQGDISGGAAGDARRAVPLGDAPSGPSGSKGGGESRKAVSGTRQFERKVQEAEGRAIMTTVLLAAFGGCAAFVILLKILTVLLSR